MNWTLQRVLQQYLYMRRGISLSHELDVKSSMCDEEWRRKHWEDNLTLNMKSTKLIDCAGGKVEVWSQYINHESNVYRKHTSTFLSQGFCTPVRYCSIERTFFHVTFRFHVFFDAGKSLNSENRHSHGTCTPNLSASHSGLLTYRRRVQQLLQGNRIRAKALTKWKSV